MQNSEDELKAQNHRGITIHKFAAVAWKHLHETTNRIATPRHGAQRPHLPLHLPEPLRAPLRVPPPLLPASPAATAASPASAAASAAPAVGVGPAAAAPTAVRHVGKYPERT